MNTFLELTPEEQDHARGGFDPTSTLIITAVTFFATYWSQMKSGFADGVLDGYTGVKNL
jgi:hypothetical protein